MGDMSKVASKYRRAIRNQTGAHFTLDELLAFAEHGALEIATSAENEELTGCAVTTKKSTRSAPIGSTSDGTENPNTGKSATIPASIGPSFIGALGLGM